MKNKFGGGVARGRRAFPLPISAIMALAIVVEFMLELGELEVEPVLSCD